MQSRAGERVSAYDPQMWAFRAKGYKELGWQQFDGLREAMIVAVQPQPTDRLLDVGTGTGKVAEDLGPLVRQVVAFDVSLPMLRQINGSFPRNGGLLAGSVLELPFANETFDKASARMVFHHIEDWETALREIQRVLRVGGKLGWGEYVALNEEVLWFEKNGEDGAFDLKEPDRWLDTGPNARDRVAKYWDGEVEMFYTVMPQYSVKNWMSKSGIKDLSVHQAVLQRYLDAPESIRRKMNITYADGDAFVDRTFAFIRATKRA